MIMFMSELGLLLVLLPACVAIKCYTSAALDDPGHLTNCPACLKSCSVRGMDDGKWAQSCNYNHEGCIRESGRTTCYCNTDKCNMVQNTTFRLALNRQNCHNGKITAQCWSAIEPPKEGRCNHQDEFACLLSIDGKKGDNDISISYECEKECKEDGCRWEGSVLSCCCTGKSCNDQTLTTATAVKWCNQMSPTTTTTTPASP